MTGPAEDVISKSGAAAKSFYSAMAAVMRGELRGNGLHGDERTFIGSKQGALTGSIYSEVRTVLVEVAFLTNKKDALWLNNKENRRLLARALAAGAMAAAPQTPR